MNLKYIVIVQFFYSLICLSASLSNHPKLLLIVFDGFKSEYLKLLHNSSFDYLQQHGVSAEYLRPINPTVTYSNHMSLLTGLNAESHGIVGNTFYDPDLNEIFVGLHSEEDNFKSKFFDVGAEPIWVTNQMAGCDRASGSIMFPCSMTPIKWYPTTNRVDLTWKDAQIVLPYEQRVDIMIEWFTRKVNPINLGLLYFGEPDWKGHAIGPESPKMKKFLMQKIGGILEYLFKKMKMTNTLDKVNLIVVSDHGMSSSPIDKAINIDDYIDTTETTSKILFPSIWPGPGNEDLIFNAFKKLPHVHIHRKSDPEVVSRNISNNRRIGPLVFWIDDGWTLITNKTNMTAFDLGSHGYSNSAPGMRAIFLAHGPAFQSGYKAPPIDTIDVYNLMCHVLGVTPAPNNGTFGHVESMLLPGHNPVNMNNSALRTSQSLLTLMWTAMLGCVISFLFCVDK